MTLEKLINILRRSWKLVALTMLVGLLAGAATFALRSAQYTATTQLYVSAQTGENPQQAYQGAQLSQARVRSYIELATSPRVLDQVSFALQSRVTPDSLAKKISATNEVDSVIISINATDEQPSIATDISNLTSQALVALVNDLERPASPNALSPVAVRIIQPAAFPDAPTSTSLPTSLFLGTLTGLLLGLATALLRVSIDTTIRTPESLGELAETPVLATLPQSSRLSGNFPLLPLDEHSPELEAFKRLRTNLQFVNIEKSSKVITVSSPLPGDGKSVLSVNLASALASSGLRTLLIEGDLRRPTDADILNLDRTVGLTSVLTGRIGLREATQTARPAGFDFLPSGPLPPNPSELLASSQMQDLLKNARSVYDFVLIDTPPLIPVTDAAALTVNCDGCVLLCRAGKTTTTQLSRAAEALKTVNARLLGAVLTMTTTENAASTYYHYARIDSNNATYTSEADSITETFVDLTKPSPHRRASRSPANNPSERF